MVSLLEILIPNLRPALTGIVVLAIAVALIWLITKLPDKPQIFMFAQGITSLVAIGLIFYGLFLIFAVSILEDILASQNLTFVLIAMGVVSLAFWLLFLKNNKNGRRKKK